jgi:hypothetical protein
MLDDDDKKDESVVMVSAASVPHDDDGTGRCRRPFLLYVVQVVAVVVVVVSRIHGHTYMIHVERGWNRRECGARGGGGGLVNHYRIEIQRPAASYLLTHLNPLVWKKPLSTSRVVDGSFSVQQNPSINQLALSAQRCTTSTMYNQYVYVGLSLF